MGKRAASRLVMVSGMSEEFWGAKERTGVGQPLLRVPTCAQVNRHNKRGSAAALRGAGQPLAPVIPRAGAVSQAEPEAEKSKPCIWHSKGCHNLWLFSSWSREKEKTSLPAALALLLSPRAPRGAGSPRCARPNSLPICAHHLAIARDDVPLPSPFHPSPHSWDTPHTQKSQVYKPFLPSETP